MSCCSAKRFAALCNCGKVLRNIGGGRAACPGCGRVKAGDVSMRGAEFAAYRDAQQDAAAQAASTAGAGYPQAVAAGITVWGLTKILGKIFK